MENKNGNREAVDVDTNGKATECIMRRRSRVKATARRCGEKSRESDAEQNRRQSVEGESRWKIRRENRSVRAIKLNNGAYHIGT